MCPPSEFRVLTLGEWINWDLSTNHYAEVVSISVCPLHTVPCYSWYRPHTLLHRNAHSNIKNLFWETVLEWIRRWSLKRGTIAELESSGEPQNIFLVHTFLQRQHPVMKVERSEMNDAPIEENTCLVGGEEEGGSVGDILFPLPRMKHTD